MMKCEDCEYYEKEGDYCGALICTPFSCDEPLPCEDTDALTLYAEGSMNEETYCIFDDPDVGDPG